MMNGTPERENFPTFQSVWDIGTAKDGSQRKLELSPTWDDSLEEENKNDRKSDAKKTSRYSLFSPGLSARALWSVSSPDVSKTIVEAWKCEECGNANYDSNDGECEGCGTGICFMDEQNDGRQFFVEEYGVDDDDDDVPPIKTPTRSNAKTPKSLRELLSRHPSFQNKAKHQDRSSVFSWGSVTTSPTTNLSPASAFSASLSPTQSEEKGMTPEIRVIDSDKSIHEEEESRVIFSRAFRNEAYDVEKSRRGLRSYMCLTPPILLFFTAVGIILALWIPMHMSHTPIVTDDGPDIDFTDGLWVQQGEELFGDEPDYQTGASVALASGGRVMAVGVGGFGPVRAYSHSLQQTNGGWVQQGQDISIGGGPKHVALSRRHGRTMAVASETDGSVAVFSYDRDTDSWGPLGEALLFGVTNRDDAKASISLSDPGNVLAVGVPSEGSLRSDSVRVVGYDSDVDGWVPVGEDIVLDAESRIQHGGSVSLSSNGMIVAVGSWSESAERFSYASHAEVYRFFNNTWQQMGGENNMGSRISPIKSEVSVSLSGDGNVVAIGSGLRCRMFQYNQEKDKWSQLGRDLDGKTVSLSTDGKVLAVGNPADDGHGSDTGDAIIYAYDAGAKSWEQIGEKIVGEMQGDSFGAALSLSEYGKRVAVGAPGSGDQAKNSGSVSVFELELT